MVTVSKILIKMLNLQGLDPVVERLCMHVKELECNKQKLMSSGINYMSATKLTTNFNRRSR
jgi:hypothetical protein